MLEYPNEKVRWWACNHVGHIVPYFHTMRCYSCNVLGHKAQYCWSTKKQPLRIFLYNSSRKASTNEGKNVERTDAKKKVRMNNTEKLHIGEVDQIRDMDSILKSKCKVS